MVRQTCMQCPGFSQNMQKGLGPHLQTLGFVPGAANDTELASFDVVGSARHHQFVSSAWNAS